MQQHYQEQYQKQQSQIDELKYQLDWLKRQVFGNKSERFNPDDDLPVTKTVKRTSWIEAFKALYGYDPRRCKECKQGFMEIVMVISPVRQVMTT